MADITMLTESERAVVDAFHRLYYPFFRDTKWLGVTCRKCPFDLFVYQELILELRPDLIIECGTAEGGSAVFLASICELAEHGKVVSIDLQPPGLPCPRVTYCRGDTLSKDVLASLAGLVADKTSVLVILDDDHRRDHVLEEMRIYGGFVTPGSYLIVEDSNINNHPVYPEFGPGPMEAIDLFLRETSKFEVDRSREKFLVSFNPRGFLRKRGDRPSLHSKSHCGFRVNSKDNLILSQEDELRRLEKELAARNAVLNSVLNSKGWKLLNRFREARARVRTLIG
jgi:cephalosporin hydroxylase